MNGNKEKLKAYILNWRHSGDFELLKPLVINIYYLARYHGYNCNLLWMYNNENITPEERTMLKYGDILIHTVLNEISQIHYAKINKLKKSTANRLYNEALEELAYLMHKDGYI